MSPKPDVSKERKSQILDAAAHVFTQKGFHKTRMDDIAQESGLSKGSLYLYFKNKDSIISGIMQHILSIEIKNFEKIMELDLSTREKFSLFVKEMMVDIVKLRPVMPILYEFWAIAFRRKKVKAFLYEYMQQYLALCKTLINSGIESGEFKSVNVDEAAFTLGSIFEGGILIWSLDPENTDLERMINSGINIFLEGIEKDQR